MTNRKTTEYESLLDFGFTREIDDLGKVHYVGCDIQSTINEFPNVNQSNSDNTTGKFFTLNEILSGGTLEVSLSDVSDKSQAELALNYSIAESLAFLGSLYSTVQVSLNNIIENYPNGFMVIDSITGVNALMFNASDTYMYGGVPFNIINYGDFELVQAHNGVYDTTFQILEEITGTTFSLFLELDGQPSIGAAYDHTIQPKQSTLDKFYSTLNQYEKDLLVPPFNRTNFWPRDLIAQNNILLDGQSYEDFVEQELSWAAEKDSEESNFIWRKLYPDGQKILDTDGLMERLVLTYSKSFDQIKKYQEQLKYQHTIGYDNFNHISKDLVELLASQWNFTLGFNLNQDDYGEFIYSTYENYITGQSQQRLSSKDVNFEIWRRVLANLTTLYKKKGTKEAIKYITNIYGVPENLLWIEEFVEINKNGKNEIVESESNIIVPIGSSKYYIDDIGSAKTLSYPVSKNTKYLNVNVSPFDAINFDFYDWASANISNISNVNNVSFALSSTSLQSQNEFFEKVYRNTIKSDGTSRYESSYPILESIGNTYYSSSPNKFSLTRLDPYIDFLDDNWVVMISNLIPSSSRLIGMGNLYKNPMWRREKYQWKSSELDPKELPFNEEWVVNPFIPSVNVETTKAASINLPSFTTTLKIYDLATLQSPSISTIATQKLTTTIDSPTLVTSKSEKLWGVIPFNDPSAEYIQTIDDTQTISYSHSYSAYQINSPLLEPISGQYGSSSYVTYDENSLVVSNQKTFDVVFSASNLSDSGYTRFEFDLFKKISDNSLMVDEEITYSIISTIQETDSYGSYKVSKLSNIDVYDYISVDTDFVNNKLVQVTFLDTGTSQMRTSPSIGINNQKNIVEFKRVINFFNWSDPIQSKQYANYSTTDGDFNLPTIDTNSRSSSNAFSTTGTVTFGGLNYLNSDILVDRNEYFYRHRAITHAPKEWGDVFGLPLFPIRTSGGTLLDSGYDINYINGIKYYGRYFMYMITPKVAIASLQNSVDGDFSPVTNDASVILNWNGVGDSNRLEIQYLPVEDYDTPYDSYTGISESSWTGTNISTVNVNSRENVGDDYIYTVQTTLEPDTYYWWRVKNFKSKINMFGYNLEYFTSTEPQLLKTGGFAGGGKNEGEIPIEPETPTIENTKRPVIQG